MTVCVLGASAKTISNTVVIKKVTKTDIQTVNTLTHPKVLLRAIEVTLSCGISFTANFPNSWTTTQIVNWVLNADAQLCGGGVGGAA